MNTVNRPAATRSAAFCAGWMEGRWWRLGTRSNKVVILGLDPRTHSVIPAFTKNAEELNSFCSAEEVSNISEWVLGSSPRMTAHGIDFAPNCRIPDNPRQFYPPPSTVPYPDRALSLEACARTGGRGRGGACRAGRGFRIGDQPRRQAGYGTRR